MRIDTHRGEPRREIVDVVVTQRLRHDVHHFMPAFAAAIRAELAGQKDGRLAGEIRRVGLGAETKCAVADGTRLRFRPPGNSVSGHCSITPKPHQSGDDEQPSAADPCYRRGGCGRHAHVMDPTAGCRAVPLLQDADAASMMNWRSTDASSISGKSIAALGQMP
jgi:hypothetical protein